MPTNGTHGNLNLNGKGPKPTISAVATPPGTETVKDALEAWHAVHARAEAAETENERLRADIAVLRARVDWLETDLVKTTDELNHYKAANVMIATKLNTIAAVFSEAVREIRDMPYAPIPTVLPKVVPVVDAEADSAAALAAKLAPAGEDGDDAQTAN